MITFLAEHWLDIVTTVLGLAYILLEYKASVWMWIVGFAMQVLGIVLYYQKGLYADCGMEFYYLTMTAIRREICQSVIFLSALYFPGWRLSLPFGGLSIGCLSRSPTAMCH